MRSRRALLAVGIASVALAILALMQLLRPPRGEWLERAGEEPARVERSGEPFVPGDPEVARAPVEPPEPGAPEEERAPRDELRWIAGRVAFPSGTPADEAVTVLALASRGEILARAPVAAGGAFRLGLAPEIRSLDLDLEARWLALSEPLRLRVSRLPDPLVLVPGGGARLRGVVRDERGAPVAGVLVRARDQRDTSTRFEDTGLAAESAADGVFELERLDPGPYSFRAERVERSPVVLEHVRVPLEEPLEIVAPTPATLAGRVLDPGGAPVASARLAWLPHWWGVRPRRLPEEQLARTDAAGRFELTGVPGGLVQLLAWSEELAASEPLKLRLAPAEERAGLELRLRAFGRIEGTLLDARGQPDAGVRIHLGNAAADPVHSDEAGAFAFDTLPPGGYLLRAALPSDATERTGRPGGGAWLREHQRSAEVELTAGETARVVLRPDSNAAEIELHGSVSAGGRPAAGAELVSGEWPRESRAWSDAEGGYELGLSGAGRHAVRVTPAEGGSWTYAVEVPAAARVHRDFELGAGSVAGRVLDHAGAPAVSAPVELDPERPARIELQLVPATTLRVEVTDGPALDGELELSVRDAHGLEHALGAFPPFQAVERPEPTLPGRTVGLLPPGRYAIEARTLDGRRAATALQLTGQPTERAVLTLSD